MDVSENRGTPESSILIGFSIINHPFWGVLPLFLETPKYQFHFDPVKVCNSLENVHLSPSPLGVGKAYPPPKHVLYLNNAPR